MAKRTTRIYWFSFIALLLLALMSSCGYEKRIQKSDYDYGSRTAGDPKTHGVKLYGSTKNKADQHDNTFFEYSNTLSNKVTQLNGVGTAIVMLTDKNAYVGLALDWTAVGTKSSGNTNEQRNGDAVYNTETGSSHWDNRQLITPFNSYFSVNDHSQLSHELKQTVARRVREFAPNVQEVHISANMDFVNQMNEYAKQAWMNRSLAPWTDDFNNLVKHQFAGGQKMPAQIIEYEKMRAKSRRGESIIPDTR
ncbi:YhcN/YlaJ family sporulation lipoprotein [Paenibacillus sp. NEAU-GSW1]|uniref:YhcN/YlaJ family sporulation lipoprotein n=1 Tax=Paenibacillus sp. NEAU-GSW1 TaxID=2682486 RepID=UPI0012E20585|nr:YhcN/YlaJ family sporulation lipoprotein [Paenibacillus sp. NEAU-GSW1]MUT65336.1 hypothetical protein [Paenibacillus sp. NEAU-GSW1]